MTCLCDCHILVVRHCAIPWCDQPPLIWALTCRRHSLWPLLVGESQVHWRLRVRDLRKAAHRLVLVARRLAAAKRIGRTP